MKQLQAIIILISTVSINCVSGDGLYGKGVNGNGYQYHPLAFPITITTEDEHLEEDIFNAIDWWNAELDFHWSKFCKSHILANCNRFPKLLTYTKKSARIVIVEEIEEDQNYLGIAHITTTASGTILKANIEIVKNRYEDRLVLEHEIGHGAFGLGHDYDSCEEEVCSVSIMNAYYSDSYEHFLTYDDAKLIFKDLLLLKTTKLF